MAFAFTQLLPGSVAVAVFAGYRLSETIGTGWSILLAYLTLALTQILMLGWRFLVESFSGE